MIENIIKTKFNSFKATIDGIELSIPMIPGNRHYSMILEEIGSSDSIPQDTSSDWLWSGTEWLEILEPVASDMINNERNRRLALPFEFENSIFDRDERSLARITGAATLAGFYLANPENDPTNLFWHGQSTPFVWIDANNTEVQMNANQTFMFGKAAADRESFLIFKARSIKEMSPIPSDYYEDKWWV